MKLKTADYDDNTGSHNALAEETKLIHYKLIHEFNQPAQCMVELADATGSMAQKYDVDPSNDSIYIGPGRLYLEDPTDTCIFDGRILRATHYLKNCRLHLFGQDWLHQLSEERIHYDSREDLDGSGLRQSNFRRASGTGYAHVKDDSGDFKLYERDFTYTANEFQNYKLLLSGDMCGTQTVNVAPWEVTLTAQNAPASSAASGDEDDVMDNDANYVSIGDDDGMVYLKFYIKGMGNRSSFVSDKPSSAYIDMVIEFFGTITWAKVQYFDDDTSSYKNLWYSSNVEVDEKLVFRWRLPTPEAQLFGDQDDQYYGDLIVYVTVNGSQVDDAGAKIYYVNLEETFESNGDDNIYNIDTNGTNYIDVSEEMDKQVWAECPYCIVDEIKEHIDGIVTGGDPLITLTTSLEATTNYMARHFIERTRLEILQEMAKADKAVFWIALGGTEVTWKSTFTMSGAASMSDSSTKDWLGGGWDYEPMRNEYHVYGVRLSDGQVYINTADLDTDPGATSKTTYGVTRSEVEINPAAYSDYSAGELGENLVDRDENVHLMLYPIFEGLETAVMLGEPLYVSSTFLNLTAAEYVCTRWEYDSRMDETRIRLHPLSTTGFIESVYLAEDIRSGIKKAEAARVEKHPSPVWTHEWA